MNISLTPELEKLVKQKVESGLYLSASEVVREGLRLLQERDGLRRFHVDQLRKQIFPGIFELENGEYSDYDVATLKAHIESIKNKASKNRKKER